MALDYFDRNNSEVIGYTPACIARVHRSKAQKQRLVVDAGASYDVNKAKLTYTWVVLQGDPDKIKIVPKKDDQSVAEITVAWHERRPVSPGSPLESNRVDIGVFVHNGAYYSAPGFVTICTLDREGRTYSAGGKILDIAHGLGTAEIRVKDWQKVIRQLQDNEGPAKLFSLREDEKTSLSVVAMDLQTRRIILAYAEIHAKDVEAKWKDAKENADRDRWKMELDKARKTLVDIQKQLDDTPLIANRKELNGSARHFVESHLAKLTQDPLFTQNHQDWLKKKRTPANEARIKAALAETAIASASPTKRSPHAAVAWPDAGRLEMDRVRAIAARMAARVAPCRAGVSGHGRSDLAHQLRRSSAFRAA